MSGQMTCAGCGKSFDHGEVGSGRCPLCGGALPSESRAKEQQSESISADAVRKMLRQRLGGILRGLSEASGTDKDAASYELVVESVRSEIAAGCGPNGEELDYNHLANQLSFMIRPLSRSGHDRLAEDVTLVQQTLERLAMVAPAAAQPSASTDGVEEEEQEQQAAAEVRAPSSARVGPPAGAENDRNRRMFMVGAGVVLLAVVVGIVLLKGRGENPAEVATPAAQPTSTPVVADAEEATAPAESVELGAFWDYISAARLAVQNGDPDAAAGQLDLAAAITREKSVVFETAATVAGKFTNQAEAAIREKNWEFADVLLARALDIDFEYGIPTAEVDSVIDRLSRTQWDYRIVPDDVAALVERIQGVEAIVELVDGSAQVGVIRGIRASNLHLEGHESVGGGKVVFDAEIELREIRTLQFTLPAKLVACDAARKRAAERRAMPPLP